MKKNCQNWTNEKELSKFGAITDKQPFNKMDPIMHCQEKKAER
jgi:hypothetical protein